MRNTTICLLALALAALAPFGMAQGTYTQIDFPGALLTEATGIDTAGDIVGIYQASNGICYGFLLTGGVFTSLVDPSSIDTMAAGINDNGQIVGDTDSGSFLYDISNQTFTDFSRPDTPTFASGINDVGTIIGAIYGPLFKSGLGFQLNGTKYSKIAFPYFNPDFTYPTSINSSGEIIGYAVSQSGLHFVYFSYLQGKFASVVIPGISNPQPASINDVGAIAGSYLTTSSKSVGFLYQNGSVQTIEFPGAIDTYANAVNNSGEVVGYFFGSDSHHHGFLWTPPADAAKK